MTKKPTTRANLPKRDNAHRSRRLDPNPAAPDFAARFMGIRYGCHGKHKRNPYAYGVAPYRGTDTDRSLCDEHAGFSQSDMARIPALFLRAERAGLAGNLIWTVDDTGWVYELMSTNVGLNEWHGYPLLTTDPFARQVWERFANWANQHGNQADRDAAGRCAQFYGFRP
jgi:hypothetical protein